jgi:hypothetical protein
MIVGAKIIRKNGIPEYPLPHRINITMHLKAERVIRRLADHPFCFIADMFIA